jgi:hypothetical protein
MLIWSPNGEKWVDLVVKKVGGGTKKVTRIVSSTGAEPSEGAFLVTFLGSSPLSSL